MSYYVRLEIAWDGEGPDPFTKRAQKTIADLVEEYLRNEDKEGYLDWLEEFRKAFAGKPVDIKVLSEKWTEGMLAYVTRRFPEAGFWARGAGEDFNDTWSLLVRDGETEWAASLVGGDRPGNVPADASLPPWPEALDVSRVVGEAGSLKFIGEILGEQPADASVAALTMKRRKGRKPQALVYVGPLEQEGFERINDLIDTRYVVKIFRDPRKLLKAEAATAEAPHGY